MNQLTTLPADHWLNKRIFWHVLGWQALLFVGCYFIFGSIYWLALYVNSAGEYNFWDQSIVNYGTKAMVTVLIYWLIFVKFKHWPLRKRLLTHLFTLPLFLVGWLFVYHRICDLFGIGYLGGRGLVWDVYIPFLFYFIPFGIFHFYEYLTKSQRQERKAMELRQLALQSEVNALKAQLEPHFLFNTLNSISASVPPQMEHTRELIAKLADTFRFGLQSSESETVPLREEILFLKTYLDLEKRRFGERLVPQFNVDENLMEHPIPPMLLQPLVENAIKHGVGNSVDPVTVGISVKRVGEELQFAVSDTGEGNPGELDGDLFMKGIGLRNTQLRLEKQFDRSLKITKNHPKGLVFSFSLPLIWVGY
ncbi:MAG: histidine kinase [Bacteroidota bacterium]